MRIGSISCRTKSSVLLCSVVLYVGLISIFNFSAKRLAFLEASDVGYVTPFLIFVSVGYSSVRFFRVNNRDYSPGERSFLFWWFIAVDAALYLIGYMTLGNGLVLGSFVLVFIPLLLMFGADAALLYVTLRHFWKIHLLG